MYPRNTKVIYKIEVPCNQHMNMHYTLKGLDWTIVWILQSRDILSESVTWYEFLSSVSLLK